MSIENLRYSGYVQEALDELGVDFDEVMNSMKIETITTKQKKLPSTGAVVDGRTVVVARRTGEKTYILVTIDEV